MLYSDDLIMVEPLDRLLGKYGRCMKASEEKILGVHVEKAKRKLLFEIKKEYC